MLSVDQLVEQAVMEALDEISPMPPIVGQYCIVRCKNDSIYTAIVKSADAAFVVLSSGSRRLVQFNRALPLFVLAEMGIDRQDMQTSRPLSSPLTIPTVNVTEIFICTDKARISIEAIRNESDKV